MSEQSPFRSTIEQMEVHEIVDRMKRGVFSDEARPIAEAILRERGIDSPNLVIPDDPALASVTPKIYILWRTAALLVVLTVVVLVSSEIAHFALSTWQPKSHGDQVALIKFKPVVMGLTIALVALSTAVLVNTRVAGRLYRYVKLNCRVHVKVLVVMAVTSILFAVSLWLVGLTASTETWVNFHFFGGFGLAMAGIVAAALWASYPES